MREIELSCDLGEAESPESRLVEEQLWPLIDAANVACGGHAGDRNSMELAVRRAGRHGVKLGAHPSYPDRLHFGRLSMDIEPDRLCGALAEQIEELRDIARDGGVTLERVKAHGALYNDAHADADLAGCLVRVVRSVDPRMAIVASPGSRILEAAANAGLRIVREAFGDRRYRPDGSLVPRGESGALLLEIHEAVAQVRNLARSSTVTAVDGSTIPIEFETICIHGDMEDAVARLQAIRESLGRSAGRTEHTA